MGSAILTAVLFALSAIYGSRSARLFGSSIANLGRVAVALVLLSAWAFTLGKGVSGAGLGWFLVSGCIGFGFGDIALFGALPRIGPRLSILLTQCLAGPVAGLAEWLWLGQKIGPSDAWLGGLILLGVAATLLPDRAVAERPHFWAGVACGVLAAIGQGVGAVITRKASLLNAFAMTPVDGGTAAFQRMLGGFAITMLYVFFFRRKATNNHPKVRLPDFPLPVGWHYILLNGLVGPSVGVGFYQFALSTTPSAIVLAIVATSPVIVMLLQYFSREEKPGTISILGALAAVAGAIALAIIPR